MIVTYNWLKEYVDLDLAPEELVHRLTMQGLEVEGLRQRYDYLDQVVVGRVAAVEDHPKSKDLKICRVETDQNALQIVCGAPNLTPGMRAALAQVGAELPALGKVAEIELRGVKSEGILCSEAELLVGPDASVLLTLDEKLPLGQNLRQALNLDDWVINIDVTPNRPDCLCVLGVAREVAGMLGRPLRYADVSMRDIEDASAPIQDLTSVTILAPEHCPRYVARVVRGVKIGPSPFWMVDRLAGVGLRAINNVVDITNYVLMELGQPLHAFDMNRLAERRIVVKTAEEGDRFTTLDGEERIMGPETLMICDAEKAVALAGIMGGLNSEIVPETTDVLIESAYFSPVGVRRTSKTLGLSTDASYRFERGLDSEGCPRAASRAALLMAELAGGRIAAGAIDAHPLPQRRTTISFSPAKCNGFLGTDIEPERMVEALAGIELPLSGIGEERVLEVPTFRVDLYREVDLFEEVARLVGYDNIPATLPASRRQATPAAPLLRLRAAVREILLGLGLSEVISYSFITHDFCDRLGLPGDDPRRNTVRIINPLSEDQSLLRTSLLPGLLGALRNNQAYQVMDLKLYEVGMIFLHRQGQNLPEERLTAAGILSGQRAPSVWYEKPAKADFYDLKGVVEELLEDLRVAEPVFDREDLPAYLDPAASARISADGRILGHLGRLQDRVAQAFDLRETPFVFELDLENVQAAGQGAPVFAPLPRTPAVSRDLALVLNRDVEAGRVTAFLRDLHEEFLEDVALFDAYEGRQLEAGLRSLAFRFLYRSADRTLTDEEVNAVHDRITQKVLNAFQARRRA